MTWTPIDTAKSPHVCQSRGCERKRLKGRRVCVACKALFGWESRERYKRSDKAKHRAKVRRFERLEAANA